MTEKNGLDEQGLRVKWLGTAVFLIFWLFVLMAGYFWAHKPFDTTQLVGLGRTFISILGWLGISLVGAGAGYWLVESWLQEEEPVVRLVLAAGVGLGSMSLGVLVLGLMGGIRPFFLWLLLLLLAFLWRNYWRQALADWLAITWPRPQDGFQRVWLIYIIINLAIAFILALVPETAWDALVYHLTGPRLFLEAGRITHAIDLPYLGFPQLGEMQFLLGMALVGDGTAPLFHFGYGIMGLALTVVMARRLFGKTAAWFSAIFYLSVPLLLGLMGDAYVDITLLFYMTAAFYAFVRWRENRDAGLSWLILMGVFGGMSAGVKYTAVAVPVALAVSVGWVSRRDGWLLLGRRVMILAVVTTGLVLPWLLENWLTTGNPVYPFLLTNGRFWDAWRQWWYDRPGTGLWATAPWRLLTAPLEATILGTTGTEYYDATIGPFILGGVFLLPVAWPFLRREEKAITGHLLWFFGVNYALWLMGLARSALLLQTRLLLPVFGITAVLGGGAISRIRHLRRPELAVDWLVQVLVTLTLGLMLFTQVNEFVLTNPLPVIIGLEENGRFLTRQLGIYQQVMDDINQLPDDSKIIFLWEPRSYACQVTCLPDALLDRWLHLTQHEAATADEIANQWRAEGITHVLLHQEGLDFIVEAGFDPIRSQDLAILAELQTSHLQEIRRWQDAYILFEVK
ncbi:MAG: phospholipid carrier-dependent glycosyltransferase [Chloroflexi bacterium]|nr:MAG: phospholipid carrier-dependent glycosyltransferase [Chloroflexota bacterium]